MPRPVELPADPRASVMINLRIVSSPDVPPRSTRFRHLRRPCSSSDHPRGREPGPPPSARCPPPVEASPASPDFVGPSPLGICPSTLFLVAAESGHRQARDRHLLASPGVPTLLELSLIHISEPTRRTPISYAV